MQNISAIFLGIIQGLTEFLPVSSSGHLVIFQSFFPLYHNNEVIFDVAVHFGTVLSIFTVYRKLIVDILKNTVSALKTKQPNPSSKIVLYIIVGTIPTGIIGLSLKNIFESLFSSPQWVGVFLIITGFILYFTKNKIPSQTGFQKRIDLSNIDQLNIKNSLWIGIAQGLAITPGISRSGSTIASAIYMGIDRNLAATFSFLISTPAILGATLLELRHIGQFPHEQLIPLIIATLTSYIFGLLGLKLVLRFIGKGRLEIFSYYLWVVGAASIIWFSIQK